MKIPTLGILGFSLKSPKTKCHLGVSPMAIHIVYYKEEGGDFPQFRAMVSFVSLRLHVAHLSTKNAPTMH
jgi:hypothetical protein